jgi:hypothetical protein
MGTLGRYRLYAEQNVVRDKVARHCRLELYNHHSAGERSAILPHHTRVSEHSHCVSIAHVTALDL